eukprot:TRINITY_DN22226_c0_g1_i1.p1 TRINITY_DN22226_c0_g1~~TRINITY_DN22226_c0_g1_i1.p1  ORF type:complete len:395 (+),score=71.02 TRINITY_DN22226_c0_g1_i1:55-1239(+)
MIPNTFNERIFEQVKRYSHIANDLKGPEPDEECDPRMAEELRLMQQRVLNQRAQLQAQQHELQLCSPYEGSGVPMEGSPRSVSPAGGYSYGVKLDELLNKISTAELRLNNYYFCNTRHKRANDLANEVRNISQAVDEISTPSIKTDLELENIKSRFLSNIEGRSTGLREIEAKITDKEMQMREMTDIYRSPMGKSESGFLEEVQRIDEKLRVCDAEEKRKVTELQREIQFLNEGIDRVKGEREKSEARFLSVFEDIVRKLAGQLKEERARRIETYERLHYTMQSISPPITLKKPTTLKLPPSTLFTHLYNAHPSEPSTPTPHPLAALDFNVLHSHQSEPRTKATARTTPTPISHHRSTTPKKNKPPVRKQLRLAPSESTVQLAPSEKTQKPRWK